jgi:hypothetical protein
MNNRLKIFSLCFALLGGCTIAYAQSNATFSNNGGAQPYYYGLGVSFYEANFPNRPDFNTYYTDFDFKGNNVTTEFEMPKNPSLEFFKEDLRNLGKGLAFSYSSYFPKNRIELQFGSNAYQIIRTSEYGNQYLTDFSGIPGERDTFINLNISSRESIYILDAHYLVLGNAPAYNNQLFIFGGFGPEIQFVTVTELKRTGEKEFQEFDSDTGESISYSKVTFSDRAKGKGYGWLGAQIVGGLSFRIDRALGFSFHLKSSIPLYDQHPDKRGPENITSINATFRFFLNNGTTEYYSN